MAAGNYAPGRFFYSLLLFFLISGWFSKGNSAAPAFGFDIHHRFSDRVRHWAESMLGDLPGGWPEKGTIKYYTALAGHDRALRGRALAGAGAAPEVTFADGNETVMICSLGFLYYALVSLGTPNVTFLVALDTGSDLFWVPCDCTSCAPTTAEINGSDAEFNIFRTDMSATCQNVPCNSSLCGSRNQIECLLGDGVCPYTVEYESTGTSSSGFLVKDILYLTTEDGYPQSIEAPIVFGYGCLILG